ncbi:MAG: hypothetical protein Q9186_004832 [Xanthomendoza sp. 1 TL-2023]
MSYERQNTSRLMKERSMINIGYARSGFSIASVSTQALSTEVTPIGIMSKRHETKTGERQTRMRQPFADVVLALLKAVILSRTLHGVDISSGFPFMKLPSEIRNQIYCYCLLVKGEINPYPARYNNQKVVSEGQSKPVVALLLVCKRIRSEAESILYGSNTWRLNKSDVHDTLPAFWNRFTQDPYNSNLRSPNLRYDGKELQFGHLVVSFDYRDLNTFGLHYTFAEWHKNHILQNSLGPHTTTPLEVAHYIHDYLLERTWRRKIHLLYWLIVNNTIAKGMTIELTSCFCPVGCCRPISYIAEQLGNYVRTNLTIQDSLQRVEAEQHLARRIQEIKPSVVGLLDDSESKILHEHGFKWGHP